MHVRPSTFVAPWLEGGESKLFGFASGGEAAWLRLMERTGVGCLGRGAECFSVGCSCLKIAGRFHAPQLTHRPPFATFARLDACAVMRATEIRKPLTRRRRCSSCLSRQMLPFACLS